DRGVPGDALATPDRHRQPAFVVHEAEAVAPLVAEPPFIDVGVEARLEPRHAPAPRVVGASAVDVDVDVAAAGATRADRFGRVEVPDPDLKAEMAVGQGAHRADVDDVAGILVLEVAAGKEADLRVIAAIEDAELTGARDLVTETHAARARDAPLGVEHHVRTEWQGLRLVDLLVDHPRVVEAVFHVVDLQPALTRLIADRAVERMVDEVELHDGAPRFLHPLGLGRHDHAVGRLGVAGDGRPRRLLDVHHAEPALAGDRKTGVIAVVRDLDAELAGRLDEIRSGRDLDFFSVDGQLGHATSRLLNRAWAPRRGSARGA